MRERVAMFLMTCAASAATAAPAKPAVTIGDPQVTGGLSAKAVAAVAKRSAAPLLACYRAELETTSNLHGTATATLTIGASGKVTSTRTHALLSSLESCIDAALAKLAFTKPRDRKPVAVVLLLEFSAGVPAIAGSNRPAEGLPDGIVNGGYAFGKDGFGPGGGGTAWGTIGTGRYGTIGYGSGAGVGGSPRAGMRGVSSAIPSIAIGQPMLAGAYEPAIVRRYIKRSAQRLSYCYEQQLATTPALQGTLEATFTIAVDGKVKDAVATGLGNTTVETCVAGVIAGLELPKPENGEVRVGYPLTFRSPP